MITIEFSPALIRFLIRLGGMRRLVWSLTIGSATLALTGYFLWGIPFILKNNVSTFDIVNNMSVLVCMPIMLALVFVSRTLSGRRASNQLAKELGSIFEPWADESRPFSRWGRHYQGKIDQRELNIHCHTPAPKRGARAYIGVYLEAAINTRLCILSKSNGASQVPSGGFHILSLKDPALNHLTIATLDADWGQRFLSTPSVREAIIRLAREQAEDRPIVLAFQPDAIAFERFYLNEAMQHNRILNSVDRESFAEWLHALQILALAAESMRPASLTAEPSPLEHTMRYTPNAFNQALAAVLLTLTAIGAWTLAIASLSGP